LLFLEATLRAPGNNAEADILISERSTGEALELFVVPQYSGGNSTEFGLPVYRRDHPYFSAFFGIIKNSNKFASRSGPILLFLGLQADKREM